MRKAFFASLLVILFSTSLYATVAPLECSWKNTCTGEGEKWMNIYASTKYFNDANNVLSSPVQLETQNSNYDYGLCCRSDYTDDFAFSIVDSFQGASCNGKFLLHFTGDTNAKIGHPDESPDFQYTDYPEGLCVTTDDQFSADIRIDSTDAYYDTLGYTCLYRTNSKINGLVSSCNATFAGNQEYAYTVWARLWENDGSLQCNQDCTSKLDNRVYSICSQQINSCENIPPMCDGSLLGGWVEFNETHEVQCSSPWTQTRMKPTLDTPYQIESKVSQDGSNLDECTNIISREYSVILDNEPTTMKVFICSN